MYTPLVLLSECTVHESLKLKVHAMSCLIPIQSLCIWPSHFLSRSLIYLFTMSTSLHQPMSLLPLSLSFSLFICDSQNHCLCLSVCLFVYTLYLPFSPCPSACLSIFSSIYQSIYTYLAGGLTISLFLSPSFARSLNNLRVLQCIISFIVIMHPADPTGLIHSRT